MSALLADTSAWHRSTVPAVAAVWRRQLEADRVATTSQVRLEVLYSARSAAEYESVREELDALTQLPCPQEVFDRALEVQHLLARRAALHHRSVKIPDLIIAAVAEQAGAIVWHYDEDFDRVAAVTGQTVEWIASRGTI